jgi:hypothetical protein
MTLQGLKIDEGYSAVPAPQTPAFEPLTQVSADAKYIVKNLVLWFLGLPLVLGLLVFAVYTNTR